MDSNIFLQISALFGITVSIAFVIKLMRQPLMVAYIIAGIVSGPLFLDLLRGDSNMYKAFSQFGIVLLLFLLGLNLDFNHLKKIGKISAIAGGGQILFTFIVGVIILLSLNFSLSSAAYLALAITFSSTIIIVKLLNDKKDTETIYGKYTIGLMLVQDIIAILVLITIGTFIGGESNMNSLFLFLLKGAGSVIALFLISKYFLPRILDRIVNSGELLFIFTITWCFGVASLVYLAGFSIEIGAVAAGLTLGSSPYQKGISSRIKPLRDFFIVLFFIILGSQMGLTDIGKIARPGIILSIFILVGNPIILYVLFRLFKFTRQNSFLSGVTAAQVSEFGFILLFTGQIMGHVGKEILQIFTMVALITIFISSYLITYNKKIFKILKPVFDFFGKDKYLQRSGKEEYFDAWVFGYHRIGWKVCEGLREKGMKYAVVDFNHSAIEKLKEKGIPAFFGDVSDIEFLQMLPLEKSNFIISTFPDPESQETFISYIRSINKKATIIATLNHNMYMDTLYKAGASYIILPHLLGGVWVYEMLKKHEFNEEYFEKLRKKQYADLAFRHASIN